MTRSVIALVFLVVAAEGAALEAQARPVPQDPRPVVPQTHLPPPGMCRIWLDNVPPAQQPAPTDCASAARNLPRNGRLIYNDEGRNPRLPLVKALKDPLVPAKATGDSTTTKPKTRPERKPAKPDRP